MRILIRKAVIWSLCLFYSTIATFRLLLLYVTKFGSQPWKPKDHSKPPPSLTDPKYGVHKFAKVNGIRIHYVEAGNPNKPLMLFVHGFPEFWYSWRNQIVEFSKDYWTVAIDMRGYNLSDKPEGIANYEIGLLAEDLRALIEHLNRKQCILICHDWGALVGWEFVEKYKFMVQKYVMMGGPARSIFKQLMQKSKDQFKRSWYVIFFQMPLIPELQISSNDFASFNVFFNSSEFTEITKDDIEAYKHAFQIKGALTGAINYYRANFSGGAAGKVKTTLDGSDGLFALGEHEKYISMKALQLTAKTFPKIRIETVPKAGHFLQQDNPEAVNRLIREFVGPASNFPVESLK